ncbi:unnamed protein product, partial [Ranitomeya imitator]
LPIKADSPALVLKTSEQQPVTAARSLLNDKPFYSAVLYYLFLRWIHVTLGKKSVYQHFRKSPCRAVNIQQITRAIRCIMEPPTMQPRRSSGMDSWHPPDGMLGKGVYVSREINKAKRYQKS